MDRLTRQDILQIVSVELLPEEIRQFNQYVLSYTDSPGYNKKNLVNNLVEILVVIFLKRI